MTTTVEAALTFMLSALFLSFLLASFKKRQSGVVVCALGGALLGLLLFSIPAAILVGIGSGCAAALFLEPPVMTQQGEKSS